MATRKAELPAAPSKDGAAAASELTGEPRRIEWEGLSFECPAVLPGTMLFDLAELESGERELAATISLLRSIIGADGVSKLREKIATDGMSLDQAGEALSGLIDTAMRAYGTSVGEPQRSGDSSSATSGGSRQISNGSTAST